MGRGLHICGQGNARLERLFIGHEKTNCKDPDVP